MPIHQIQTDWLEKARELRDIFKKNAHDVDCENKFPKENIDLLKESGFMKLFIPEKYGGYGVNYNELYDLTRILSQGCMSTAIIWAMHFQQVMVLCLLSESDNVEKILQEICEHNFYVGSVTTEFSKGGTLLEANSPLIYTEDGQIILNRLAPVVTGGDHCDAYLITMRRSESAAPKEVVLVYVKKSEVTVKKISSKKMLGLRGTYTVGIDINGEINAGNIINQKQQFKNIAISSMIPVGHLVWVYAWIGSIETAYNHVREELFRNPKMNKKYLNEILLNELASVQMNIDLVRSYAKGVSLSYSANKNNIKYLSSNKFQLKINNVKIISSEILYKAINKLIEIAGLNYGYINSKNTPLERILRDLRSSYLMFNNNRLKSVNSKLILYEEL